MYSMSGKNLYFNEMKKQNIPEEISALITEEEIIMFQELQIKIKEFNNKTNLTRLIDGDDYWVSQVFDSIWPFKAFQNINFKNINPYMMINIFIIIR